MLITGSRPNFLFCNFNPTITRYKGDNLTLICNISSNLPVSSVKWEVHGRHLPPNAVVSNQTAKGILYSILSLHNLSFEDDSGKYTNIVSNQCGTSSVSVYIDVRKGRRFDLL